MMERGDLLTEQQNTATINIDAKSIPEILEIINREDQTIAEKVSKAIPEITKIVELPDVLYSATIALSVTSIEKLFP